MIWGELALCAALIILAGSLLSKYGDVIAEKTGLGRAWNGGILIAGVTPLTELASGVSAVAWLDALNLDAGATLGSCLFNITLFFVYGMADGMPNFWEYLTNANAFAAVMSMMMTGAVIISLLYRASLRTPYRFSWNDMVLIVMCLPSFGILYQLG